MCLRYSTGLRSHDDEQDLVASCQFPLMASLIALFAALDVVCVIAALSHL